MIKLYQGDCRDVLKTLPDDSVHCVVTSPPVRDEKGRFKKGHHWRKIKPYWDREWLFNEYVIKGKSAAEIASDFSCGENNILYFLKKLGIETRTISEARTVKYWGSAGRDNPMYGRNGELNPNWKGGVTAERQALYSSKKWADAVKKVWKRDKASCQRCGKFT